MLSSYQTELDTLLNICSKSLSELERSICPQYKADYDFLQGQMQFPQVSRITPVIDTADVALRERAKKRKADRESYYEEMRMNDSFNSSMSPSTLDTSMQSFLSSPTPSKHPRVNQGINTSAILDNRRARRNLYLTPADYSCNVDDSEDDMAMEIRDTAEQDDQTDTAWAPPLRYTREQNRRPDYVELKIPTRTLPETMAKTNTVTRTSIRNELKTTATILQAGGASIKDITLSKSSIHRKRAQAVKEAATQKKGAFTAPEFGVVHFDGKIVQYADHSMEDRLAVLLSSPTVIDHQFLGSTGTTTETWWSTATCILLSPCATAWQTR